jgi:hypothetical protein
MLRLFVNVYTDPDPKRAAELAECLCRNTQNPLIDQVISLEGRPKFREFFDAVNRIAASGDISVIANSDIYFDGTLEHVATLGYGDCFALSRWNVTESGASELFDRSDSQDAWVFRGPVKPLAANFPMGLPGCDNRLARLLADAGYRVSNPSRTVRAHHLHLSRVWRYSRERGDVVPGPYLSIPPTVLDCRGRRILHVALLAPGAPQAGLRDALRSIAGEYRELDWMSYQRAGRLDELRAEFLRLLQDFAPTVIFAQLQTSDVLSAHELAQAGCPIVCWSGDLRNDTPAWAFELAPHVISCFSNLRDVQAIRSQGYEAEYLQIGMSPRVFTPDGARLPQTLEIVFLGSDHGWFPLSGQRREMVALLSRRYGRRFGLFGHGWSPPVPCLGESEEAAVYRGCRIAVNQNHYDDVARFTSDRLLRAMGCGAFVVSNHYPGIELEFTPGVHLATWRDLDELIRRIDYYLEHDDERQSIARAGCAHVHANHTWGARMKDLEVILERSTGQWWSGLDQYARQIHSQTGEDGVIERIFGCIGTTNRSLVDIGAGDGVTISNTRALVEQGWSALLLDTTHGGKNEVICASVDAGNVNAILDAHHVSAEFDLLSLDIDGIDYWVWHALHRRPRVVVIEFNGTIPEHESRTVPYEPAFRWDGSDYYGASLRALVGLGRSKGYTLVHQLNSLNAFFVRSDLLPPDVHPTVRYAPHQYHPRDQKNRPWQPVADHARAFNGDPFAADDVADLCRRYAVATIIEGGTFEGETTPYLAVLADRIYTIEIDDQVWPKSQHLDGIPNVTRIKGSCPVQLRTLLPTVQGPVLYFADSHAWGHPSPLLDELRAFAEHGIQPVLVVHDFQNPDHPEFGYDTYEGQAYEWNWIRPDIEAIYGGRYRHYFNKAAAGARRGILYVVPAE